MDGRENGAILSTPGGDAGEFILGLFVYEGMTRELSQQQIDSILEEYLRDMKKDKFYMCTDDDAISHLENELGMSLSINILRQPPRQDQRDLIKALIKADNQGDRHLKNLLKNPNLYSIRKELVQMFLISFFKILWNDSSSLREKLHLENLVGVPQEQAFLEIRNNEICEEMDLAPRIFARKKFEDENRTIQVFVNHIDAVSQQRKSMTNFFL